jgi:gamma-glutamylputrescine oxidase
MARVDPDPYGSSWYAVTAVASPPRPPLTGETDVDVCVIGAGLAGLTVAREVARRGWSVLVLEARSVAWNASGRNSGFVLPGFAMDAEALITRVGLDHARQLWALSEAGVAYVRNAIAEAAMTGVEPTAGGWLHVTKSGRVGAMEAVAERLTALGASVEFWPWFHVRELLHSRRYFDAVHHPGAFSIHPLNYALGLAAAAEASGAHIHEGTEALQIDPVGVRKRIVTKDARVRAGHVVLAGNVHVGRLMPQFAATLLPTHRYVVVTAPLGAALHQTMQFGGAVSDTELADNHYRIVGGDRLMWSGRSTVWRGKPGRYIRTLLSDLTHTYPALREARAEFAWTGTLGHTVHLMPQIGENSPGLWLLSGFGGHGLNTTAIGGELIARAIVDGDRTLQLFEPFAMVWAGGVLGRAAQQMYYWGYRSSERAASLLARRRERRDIERPKRRPRAPAVLRPPSWEPQPAAASPPSPTQLSVADPPPAAAPSAAPVPNTGPLAEAPAIEALEPRPPEPAAAADEALSAEQGEMPGPLVPEPSSPDAPSLEPGLLPEPTPPQQADPPSQAGEDRRGRRRRRRKGRDSGGAPESTNS